MTWAGRRRDSSTVHSAAAARKLVAVLRGRLLGSTSRALHFPAARRPPPPGVALVAPVGSCPGSDPPATPPFTLAPMGFGVDVAALERNRRSPPPRVRSGRRVPTPGSDEVVLGSQVARHFQVDTGATIAIRGKTFRVAGVLEPTLTGPDSFVFMPFATAESLLVESEPLLRRLALVPGSTLLPIATAAAVFWADGEDPEAVAVRIRERIDHLSVVSPADA